MNSVFQDKFVKIYQETQSLFEEFHVAQQLSLVDRQHFYDGFHLDDQRIIN
jgi:hypothetical protein